MANSRTDENFRVDIVVNCFQISNFVLWQTAGEYLEEHLRLL